MEPPFSKFQCHSVHVCSSEMLWTCVLGKNNEQSFTEAEWQFLSAVWKGSAWGAITRWCVHKAATQPLTGESGVVGFSFSYSPFRAQLLISFIGLSTRQACYNSELSEFIYVQGEKQMLCSLCCWITFPHPFCFCYAFLPWFPTVVFLFFPNPFSILLWLCSCIWLYLFNSLRCLYQFHCPAFHILNLHSFCLLYYSFFIHLF